MDDDGEKRGVTGMYEVTAAGDLAAQTDLSSLFRSWLDGDAVLGSASRNWEQFLTDSPESVGKAPIWSATTWRERWLPKILADLPDETARERCRAGVAQLCAGEAAVVVTGQQPGFLGGPLYTLLKIAAAIAAASARSSAGFPTVPLFWLGDDDDDRREAFAPVLYDPQRDAFLRARTGEGQSDRMMGTVTVNEWAQGEIAWLNEQAGRNALARDLAALGREALAADWTWSRWQRRCLLRIFAGTDLLIVSGNDAELQAVAEPLYSRLWTAGSEMEELARQRGELLIGAGYHAQIGNSSLQRYLHLEAAGRRQTLTVDPAAEMPAASRLRPGVAARSLVQDWLFRPAAVVVGPGELAYLQQLAPLYDLFSIPRSPLLPRLFAQLIPPGSQPDSSGGDAMDAGPGAELDQVVTDILEGRHAAIVSALETVAGVGAKRAANLAQQQLDRWRDNLEVLLLQQYQRIHRRRSVPKIPWLTGPKGQRQERTLASFWAAALWGESLAPSLLAAADTFFTSGADSAWRQYAVRVTSPEKRVTSPE
ncbi:MAG: bacillithiol biosynthesis BshC [bacterium]